MARFSRKGWVIRTALRKGRFYREVFDAGDGTVRCEPRTELEMRAIIEKRMNFFEQVDPDDADNANENESLWRFKELAGPFKWSVGSSLEFLAPGVHEIRRIRANEAEQRRVAKAAAAERREIKSATARPSSSRTQRSSSGAGNRL